MYILSHINVLPVETKAQAAVTDTVKHRLEQLDDFEEVYVAMTMQHTLL